ncbi:hypothetical protein GCM10011348_22140 [Marinobacterium nitratireducens]|uniref:Uncharacterized protein n=1 Tax=Marinobacterium nitratireducens TaxID=518897 RepID=A0A917ZGZ2_9GAMM|nr:hypothetical protein [Marinobacterium nitratireducens]GGO81949.1 hypothetical protein GCM10011348_22140 [Marinobacterium nitratireducens]
MAAVTLILGTTSLGSVNVKKNTPSTYMQSTTSFLPQPVPPKDVVTVPVEAVAKTCRQSHKKVMALVNSLIEDRFIGAHEYATAYSANACTAPSDYHLDESAVLKILPFICGRTPHPELLKLIKRLFRKAGKHWELDEVCRTPDWQKNRSAGKIARKDLSQVVDEFRKYSIEQGSKNAVRQHGNITRAIYKALFPTRSPKDCKGLRDRLTDHELALLATAEIIAKCALTSGMAQNRHYKAIYEEVKERLHAFACLLSENDLTGGSEELPNKEAA